MTLKDFVIRSMDTSLDGHGKVCCCLIVNHFQWLGLGFSMMHVGCDYNDKTSSIVSTNVLVVLVANLKPLKWALWPRW